MSEEFFTLDELKARYWIFEKYALQDQRHYYQSSMRRFEKADEEVSRVRARIAFLTGLASITAGLLVQTQFLGSGQCAGLEEANATCGSLQLLITILVILSVILPPVGVFFSTLADTFQWATLRPLYERSLENIEVADALSPDPEMSEEEYQASYQAFVKATLAVMREETSRFEVQSRTPEELQAFIEAQRKIAYRVGGDPDRHKLSTDGDAT